MHHFTTINGLEAYVEELMGSEGSHDEAVKLTQHLIIEGYFELEWDGYYSTKKWKNMEYEAFFDLWSDLEDK